MYLCLCKSVKEADVKQLARAGMTAPEALIAALGLLDAECCGRCADDMEDFILVAVTEWAKARSAGL
jgi:bacterioferritin-associated ferredoxin